VDESVMEKAGVTLDSESVSGSEPRSGASEETAGEGAKPDDERLSVFREFINSLDIDDIDRPRGESEGRS
jgi:uncharacterized protein